MRIHYLLFTIQNFKNFLDKAITRYNLIMSHPRTFTIFTEEMLPISSFDFIPPPRNQMSRKCSAGLKS